MLLDRESVDWLSREEEEEEEGEEEGESVQTSPRDALCRENSGSLFLPRHGICPKFYTAGFSG